MMKKEKGRLVGRVGSRLRDLRHQAGLTQAELGRKAGLTAKYVSEIENGHRDLRISTLERVAKAVRTDPAELLRIGPVDVSLSRIGAMLKDREEPLHEHVVDVVREVLRLVDAVK